MDRRVGGQLAHQRLVDQGRRRGVGDAVAHVLGQLGLVLGAAQELDQFFSIGLHRRAFHDDPAVHGVRRVLPDHLEVLLVFLVGGGDAAVVGAGEDHVTGGQHLRRLRAALPEHQIGLDRVELLEGALDTVVGAQHFVDVLGRHAVSDQRHLQIPLGTVAQRALAWVFFGVEEIGPAGGRGLGLVAVIGQHQVVDDGAHAAGMHAARQVAAGTTDLGGVQLFEQALVAAHFQLVGLDLHHVPAAVAALDLGAQHAQPAVPGLIGELGAAGIEGLEEHLFLAVLIGTAPGDDVQVAGMRCGGGQGGQGGQRDQGQGFFHA